MRQYATPPTVTAPPRGNLTDDLLRHADEDPDAVMFSHRSHDGWSDVTAAAFLSQVRSVAKGLVASGVTAGDRVALMSHTRYEWTLLDYATWYAGAVTVPVYPTSTAAQVAWVLRDAGCAAAVVETPEHRALVEDSEHAPARLWSLDDGAVSTLTAIGRDVPDADLEERRSEVGAADTATLIYTSGTTGRPKGCVLSHGNFLTEVAVAVEQLDELFDGPDASVLLFLPLAHVLARVVQVGAVRSRVRLGYAAGPTLLLDDLAEFRPTFVLGVPRFFERVFNTASQLAAADGHGRTFDRAVEIALRYSRSLDEGGPGRLLRRRHAGYDKRVYVRVRELLGGRCRYAVSGGAPLGDRLGHFFRGAGITVLEGYGLTETTAAVTLSTPQAMKVGTVGRPLPGTALRVGAEGELEVRGPQVFRGYWSDPVATTEALDEDGWLRTGDVGEIDDEGFVRVTGRRTEILVTAGGKNVAPAPLEDVIRAHPLVSQCMVVGDGRPFVAALVTLDREAARLWAEERAKSTSLAALARDPDVRAEVQKAVDAANQRVSQAEAVRGFAVLPEEWSEAEGHLTPSLKLKRNVVLREYAAAVEELYGF